MQMSVSDIRISRFLPNPNGKDADGEWVELENTGSGMVSLDGWSIGAAGAKKYSLSGTLAPGEKKIFERAITKLTLSNKNGSVALFDPDGITASVLSFTGSAPSGIACTTGLSPCFAKTAAKSTKKIASAQSAKISFAEYPKMGTIEAGSGYFPVVVSALSCAVLVTLGVYFFYSKSHDISQLFFGRNE